MGRAIKMLVNFCHRLKIIIKKQNKQSYICNLITTAENIFIGVALPSKYK